MVQKGQNSVYVVVEWPLSSFLCMNYVLKISKRKKIRVWCYFAKYEISHLDDLGQGQHELGYARWWESYHSGTV